MIRIPLKLKEKLCNMEGYLNQSCPSIEVTTMCDGHNRQYIQGLTSIELELFLNDDDSIDACKDWFHKRSEIDIGPYKGIMPISVDVGVDCNYHNQCKIVFNIKEVDANFGTWRDWFIQEETNYADKL